MMRTAEIREVVLVYLSADNRASELLLLRRLLIQPAEIEKSYFGANTLAIRFRRDLSANGIKLIKNWPAHSRRHQYAVRSVSTLMVVRRRFPPV